jgi:hypothetical protein
MTGRVGGHGRRTAVGAAPGWLGQSHELSATDLVAVQIRLPEVPMGDR